MRHHVYLSPGMFGFGKLGSYTYFAHVERGLVARFAAAGHELVAYAIDDLPTASIRRRATRLADIVAQTSGGEPVHLLGHSTGGLDARLCASPATRTIPAASLGWLPQLRSVTAMNTPHHGTPLASFFATAKGQHVLAAMSVLTVAGLTLGKQPLAIASMLLGVLRAGGDGFPLRIAALDRAVAAVVSLVDDARSPELRTFLAAINDDQGSMIQLSPEAMDLFAGGFADRDGVVYQSTASMAPPPRPRGWLATLGHPWRALSFAVFTAFHRLTANHSARYPCAAMRDGAPWAGDATEATLRRALGAPPPLAANDGVVPLRSQLWGRLVWAGLGDHLDVLGHFRDDDAAPAPPEGNHRDWLTSGSAFDRTAFAAQLDAIAAGMLGGC